MNLQAIDTERLSHGTCAHWQTGILDSYMSLYPLVDSFLTAP